MADGNAHRGGQALREHALLFDTSSQAVIATDSSGAIRYWNAVARRIYGWEAAEVLGRDILEVTPARPVRANAAEIMERLRAGSSWSGEFLVRGRDGDEFTVYVSDFPIRDPTGELIGIIGVSRPVEFVGIRK